MGRKASKSGSRTAWRRRDLKREAFVTVAGARNKTFQVRPSVIDDSAIAAYIGGQCHALALALHKATGWPIIACEGEELNDDELTDEEEFEIWHFVVQVPDGRY